LKGRRLGLWTLHRGRGRPKSRGREQPESLSVERSERGKKDSPHGRDKAGKKRLNQVQKVELED